jgi:hypothetical protein
MERMYGRRSENVEENARVQCARRAVNRRIIFENKAVYEDTPERRHVP